MTTGQSIHTTNGTSDTIFVVQIPLGKTGKHDVKILTGATGGFFSFQWAGDSTGNYLVSQDAPRVLVGAPPQQGQSYVNVLIAPYVPATKAIVDNFAAQGLDVELAPTATALDITTDISFDTIHPNDAGHAKLAKAFESVY